jgi:hypothetical protein
MGNLDIVIHNETTVSIKDLEHNLDIADFKWDKLIDLLRVRCESIYFSGFRLSYETNPQEIINYVAEEKLYIEDEGEAVEKVLIRVREINVISRALLSKLWKAYDEPALIFLTDKNKEQDLIGCMSYYQFGLESFKRVSGIYELYQSYEADVMWIQSNVDIRPLLLAIED